MIDWIEYPRPLTTVKPGRWMVTVQIGHTLTVEILELEAGDWWRGSEKLSHREQVVAIAYVPEPPRFARFGGAA